MPRKSKRSVSHGENPPTQHSNHELQALLRRSKTQNTLVTLPKTPPSSFSLFQSSLNSSLSGLSSATTAATSAFGPSPKFCIREVSSATLKAERHVQTTASPVLATSPREAYRTRKTVAAANQNLSWKARTAKCINCSIFHT